MQAIDATGVKKDFNIAVVVSRFNHQVTLGLLTGTVERLHELGFTDEQISIAWVPGAIEIPVVAQQFAKKETIAAVICLGAVIRGETNHYDYVCNQVSNGCQRVALNMNKPVVFGILTTDNEEQAIARIGGKHGHKGREAAEVAYEMVSIMRQIG
jgi:6,7-dimethyl-8-ribityllumazine synthase